jgi:hypothetical protein
MSNSSINTPAESEVARLKRKTVRLSVAVWVLALLLCATLLVSWLVIRAISTVESGFSDFSPGQRIGAATVIALAEWQKSGASLRCVISEIVKQAPNTDFYYKAGDEFQPGSRRVHGNADFGDGVVLFFTGSPATFEMSVAHRGGRITGMGDMRLADLVELARPSVPDADPPAH